MRITLFTVIIFCSSGLQGQSLEQQRIYDDAYIELESMFSSKGSMSFKNAVFITENAFRNNEADLQKFNAFIKELARHASLIANQGNLLYNESDKAVVQKYAAVYRLMTDTVRFYQDSSKYYDIKPYKYDFEDFWGEKDWTKMFVTKLLATNKGNCHSLPFLYKILCEELGVKAHLSMAPNHTYIKLWCKKLGWYNTELTSGYFPIDAWIMASGYVHLNAVRNRIYMDTLSDKQSIAVCVIDLAKGYERKFGDYANSDFILKCCELALLHYPNYVNGLILKAETLKRKVEAMMKKYSVEYPSQLFDDPKAKSLFDDMQKLYAHIHELGYRKMPRDMYLNWLSELNTEKEKYLNKEIHNLNSK